jgi:Transposase DDE domain
MTHTLPLTEDWDGTVARLGGAPALAASARQTRAFVRPREVKSAVDLLRLILAYCLGGMGLRATSAWAAAIGVADLSNVALLQRLRQSSDWLEHLVGRLMAERLGPVAEGRPVRLVDATTVPQAGRTARRRSDVWRLHCAFDLPEERFSFCTLTDGSQGEQFDRVPVVAGEIRIGDRGYLHPERIAAVQAAGADLIVRAGWKAARWLDEQGEDLDVIRLLKKAEPAGRLETAIGLARPGAAPLGLRLVALRKPPEAAARARAKARRAAQREGRKVSAATLTAADWVLLVTTLAPDTFTADAIGQLYRARWRVELAFKRTKSLIGLAGPPGRDARVAKTWILAHLLMVLLLEPHVSAPEVSPRWAA